MADGTLELSIVKVEPNMYMGEHQTDKYGLPKYNVYDQNGTKHSTTQRQFMNMVGQTVEVRHASGTYKGSPWSKITLNSADPVPMSDIFPTTTATNPVPMMKRVIQPVDVNAAIARSIEYVQNLPEWVESEEKLELVKYYAQAFLDMSDELLNR